jgi:hypothetical protein
MLVLSFIMIFVLTLFFLCKRNRSLEKGVKETSNFELTKREEFLVGNEPFFGLPSGSLDY